MTVETKFFEALFDGTTTLDLYTPDIGTLGSVPTVEFDNGYYTNQFGVIPYSSLDIAGGYLKFPTANVGTSDTVMLKLPDSTAADYYVEIEFDGDPQASAMTFGAFLRASTMTTSAWSAYSKNSIGGFISFYDAAGTVDDYWHTGSDGLSDYNYNETTGETNGTYTIKVEVIGDTVNIYRNGALATSSTTTDPNLLEGGGLETYVMFEFDGTVASAGGYLSLPIRRITAATLAPDPMLLVYDKLVKEYDPFVPANPGVPAKPAYCINIQHGVWVEVWNEYIYTISVAIPIGGGFTFVDYTVHLWVDEGYIDYAWEKRCYPATAGIPPTEARAANFNKGWSGGARSIQSLSGNVMYQFSIPKSVVGVVTGLNDGSDNAGYIEIDHALYFTNGEFYVIEKGVQKTLPQPGTYVGTDVFSIVRVGPQVQYWQNNLLVYVSEASSSGYVVADASLYFGLDEIDNALLTNAVDATFINNTGPEEVAPGTTDGIVDDAGNEGINGTLTPFIGFSVAGGSDGGYTVDTDPFNENAGSLGNILKRFTGSALSINNYGDTGIDTVDADGNANCVFAQFTGEAYGSLIQGAVVSNTLTAFTGQSESGYGLLQPQYAASATTLQPILGFALTNNAEFGATASGTLGPFRGYTIGNGLSEWVTSQTTMWGMLGLSTSGLTAPRGATRADLPSMSLYASGQTSYQTLGLDEDLPALTISAHAGGQAKVKGPKLALSASGTTTTIGSLDEPLPAVTLSASGKVTTLARGYLVYKGKYLLTGTAGGQLDYEFPVLTLEASGTISVLGRAEEMETPALTLEASGYSDVLASADIELPAIVAAPSAVGRLVLPMLRLEATAYEDLDAEYEAYVVTIIDLQNGQQGVAVTRLTQYPFDRIVRYQDKYYGVGQDGVFELDGDDYDGTPIVAEIETAETDFGQPTKKRVPALFITGRVDTDFEVSVVSSELETDTYTYVPVAHAAADTHRVVFGRGIRANYIAYRMTNTDGGDFTITGLLPEIDFLRRTI